MKVKVIYEGRAGNRLFQTIFGMWIETLGHDVYYIDHKNVPPGVGMIVEEKNLPLGMYSNKLDVKKILDIVSKSHDELYLSGYWQSFAYSSDIITQAKEFVRSAMNVQDVEVPYECVVHVRGGDYKNWGLFDICNREYYTSCLEQLKPESFIVVSDDMDYAKKLLEGIPGATFHTGTPFQDFSIIANAKTGIIPNSTFSLMATWVGEGKFYAPYPWFNPDYTQEHEATIYPYHDRCIQVKV